MKMQDVMKLRDRALRLHEQGDYPEAERLLLDALYLLDSKEHPLYQSIVYGLGINYALQENYDGAKLCFEEGRANAKAADNIEHELDMLHQLVLLTQESRQHEAAAMLCEEEVLYREKYRPNDYEELAIAYLEGSRNAFQLGDKAASDKLREQAKDSARKTGDEHCIAGIALGIGDLYQARGEWELASECYRQSEALYRKLGNQKALATVMARLEQIKNLREKKEG